MGLKEFIKDKRSCDDEPSEIQVYDKIIEGNSKNKYWYVTTHTKDEKVFMGSKNILPIDQIFMNVYKFTYNSKIGYRENEALVTLNCLDNSFIYRFEPTEDIILNYNGPVYQRPNADKKEVQDKIYDLFDSHLDALKGLHQGIRTRMKKCAIRQKKQIKSYEQGMAGIIDNNGDWLRSINNEYVKDLYEILPTIPNDSNPLAQIKMYDNGKRMVEIIYKII